MKSIATWLRRWQEPVVWLPALAVIAIAAWVVLGALDPASTVDVVARLIELPIQTAYAIAALGLAWLARRRQRRKLSKEEGQELWAGIIAGRRGPLIVYITDTIVWIACVVLLLHVFSP